MNANDFKGGRIMSRHILRALGLTALLALAASSAWAGSDERKGTGGATELLLQVGPRGSALGGGTTSDVSGVDAIFWNPAGLAGLEGSEVLFSHTQYIADMKLNYAAVAARAGALGVIGFNAKVLSIGDVIVTTEDAPDGTGEVITPTFTVLGLSWARQFTDRVNFGGTLNLVNEQVLAVSATGVAMDLGVQYDTGWRGLKLGMVMKNFGTTMEYGGANLEVNTLPPGSDPSAANRTLSFSTAPFEMPSFFTLAATYNLYQRADNRLQMLGAFQNNNFVGDSYMAGAEWNYRDMFALRGSWFGTVTSQIDANSSDESLQFDSGDDLYSGYAFGAGANVKTGSTRLSVDVAYRPVRNFFDDTVEVGLKLKF